MKQIIETERLSVRKFRPEDAARLYEIHTEESVKKWIPNESYTDIEECREAIGFYMDHVNAGSLPYVLAVILKEDGSLIGDTGVNAVEGRIDEVEIGYIISEAYSGKGYGAELLAAMTEYVFTSFRPEVLYGRVIKGNAASIRVLEKSGYTFLKEEFGAEDDPYGRGMLVYIKKA